MIVAGQRMRPADVPTAERMKELSTAMANFMLHAARGEHETEEGVNYTVDQAKVEELIEDWPNAPKMAARKRSSSMGRRTRRQRRSCSGIETGRGSAAS